MAIVEIIPYDLLTADEARVMSPLSFWAAMARYARTGTGRLLMIADNLRAEDVLAGFEQVAVPYSKLPQLAHHYRQQYEDHLAHTTQSTRLMRLFLLMDSQLDSDRLAQLLGTYGVRARPLSNAVPLPFAGGQLEWNRLVAEDGTRWAVLQSSLSQTGSIVPNALHRLFNLEFPVWCALDIYTYPSTDAIRLLRTKDAAAKYERADTTEHQSRAADVRGTVAALQQEMSRVGAALHTVRLNVLVGAEDERELSQRLEIVRGASPLDLAGGASDAALIGEMFSPAPPRDTTGSLLSSVGLTLLASSAMSYRRRGETRGVKIGTDRNLAPVIFNIFDDRQPSYNAVVLGQTGFGKTFAIQLLMLRHLLMGKRIIIVDPQGNIDLSWLGESHHHAILGTDEASINVIDIVDEELANQVEMVVARLALLGVINAQHPIQRAVLDEVLMDIYAPIWGQNIPLAQMPTLASVQSRLQIMAGTHSHPSVREIAALIAYNLTPYVTGSRAALFGRATTVDFSLDHHVTVYDVSRLPKEEMGNLRTALLSVLVGNVDRSIRQRRRSGDTTQTMFFVDEIGVLMRDEVVAAFVSEQFKTARARGVSMIVADQELTSLLGTADRRGTRHGRMMLATAVTRLIFNQTGGDLPMLSDAFPDIPQELLSLLPHLPQGSCIAQLPDDLLLLDVQANTFELAVLTSRLQDRAARTALLRRFAEEAAMIEPHAAPVALPPDLEQDIEALASTIAFPEDMPDPHELAHLLEEVSP